MKQNGKDAFYFPHDANARQDPKIAALLLDYGTWGYGAFWMLIEMLRDQPDYSLERTQYVCSAFALQLQCDVARATEFIQDCIAKYCLIEDNDGNIHSPSLTRRMKHVDEKREKNRENAGKRWKPEEPNATAKRPQSTRKATAKRSTLLSFTLQEDIYDLYAATVRAGSKQDAMKWIERRLKDYSEEQIRASVNNYAAEVKTRNVEYRKQANNFFGSAELFKEYLVSKPTGARKVSTIRREPWEDDE